MRQSLLSAVLLLPLILALAGCGQFAAPAPLPTSPPASETTASPTKPPLASQTPTATLPSAPTVTLPVPTETLTPTRTPTPTATATFDPAGLVRSTRAPAAKCPAIDPAYRPNFPERVENFDGLNSLMLDALNHGASAAALQTGLNKVLLMNVSSIDPVTHKELTFTNRVSTRDLTGDGNPEVLFFDGITGLDIFTCQDGQYILALSVWSNLPRQIEDLQYRDLNRNGIPEVVISLLAGPLHGEHYLYIYEWNGTEFANLVMSTPIEHMWDETSPGAYRSGECTSISLKDVDGNGTVDVVLRGIPCDFGEVNDTGPWRFYTVILTWNGAKFQPLPMHLDPPEYRFQAVQDGDLETWRGNFAGAIKLYHQALEDKSLKGWSIDRYRHQGERIRAAYDAGPMPTQYPSDPNEYAVLSAYIHYRLLLIDSAQGNLYQARAGLASFQKEVQPGQPGYDYLTLANVFWSTYQDTHDLAAACIKTRQFANDHREAILEPINDAWHGWQSPGHSGDPTDEQVICPFE